jgi:methylase of polypeptide subunit release factors
MRGLSYILLKKMNRLPKDCVRDKLEEGYTYKENYITTLCGYQFIIYPDVFNPDVFYSTHKIIDTWIYLIRTIRPNSLLEIGTGAGYIPILSILNGANYVIATDITSQAIANAQANVDKYNMNDRIRIFQGSIFEPLNENEQFDVIFWNLPFGDIDKPIEQLNLLERSLFDPGYGLSETYIKEAHKYLNENGRLFIVFSKFFGNFQRLIELTVNNGWRLELIENCDCTKSQLHDANDEIDVNIYELIKV